MKCIVELVDALRTGFALLYLIQWIHKNNEKEMDP